MLAQKIIVSGKGPQNQSKMSAETPEKKTVDQNTTLNETIPSEGKWMSPTFQPPITTSTPKLPEMEQEVQPPLGKTSTRMICPYCSSKIWTRVETKPSLWAWVAGIALACIGCVLCSCVPCCLESFEETTHFCPKCNATLGSVKPRL